MEEDGKPSSVRYEHQDDSVSFTDSIRNERTAFKGLREGWMAIHKRSRSLPWKAVLLTSLVTASSTYLVLFYLFGGKPSSCGESVEAFSSTLPEVMNLRLLSAEESFFTVTWERPKGRFDFYQVEARYECPEMNASAQSHRMSSCSSGTIIHTNQTQVTCGPFSACANISFGISTLTMGPPEHSSSWTTLDIVIHTEDLPNVVNLRLVSTTDNSFTLTWERPDGSFDYYVLYISHSNDDSAANSEKNIAGSCANGTIIQREQTQVTCEHLETCSYVNIEVRTHTTGPPERTSTGAVLHGIFIPGEDQVPPVGITMVSLSAYETLIRWEPPPKVFGFLTGYTVQTCHTFALCDADESVKGCTEHHTFEASLKIQTKADTPYCILVIAIVRCGMDTISSPPAAQEIRTPLVDLPDVQNLHLVSAGNHAMTVTWDRPQAEFDYYRIDVAAANKYTDTSSGMHNVGSCINGTIIHPDRNLVTCGYLEACSSVTFRISTYRKGPPELVSSDTSLQDILIPGEAPDSPRNISIETQAPALTVMMWEPPAMLEGVLGEYLVKICKTYTACVLGDTMWNCTEYRTSSTMFELNGTTVPYCMLLTATSHCGTDVLVSSPFAMEVTAPISAHRQRELFQWVAWHGDTVPENAVAGGQDKFGVMYICRAKHDCDVIPGKLVSWHSKCYLAYDGAEHSYDKYEALVSEETPSAVEWVPVFNCSLPSGIVQGGITYDGVPLYIGRTNHSDRLNIGKVLSSDGCLYIPYYGKEHRYTDYEALVVEYINN